MKVHTWGRREKPGAVEAPCAQLRQRRQALHVAALELLQLAPAGLPQPLPLLLLPESETGLT